MSYRITLELGGFDGLRDAQESFEKLAAALDGLIAQDVIHLRWHPTTPLLYQSGVRYEPEPLGAEFWRDIPTVLQYGTGDCLPVSTLVLRDDYTFAPIIALRPGDRIMEDGQATIVQECVVTGEKSVLAFALSNGRVLRASPEHRLFTADDKEVRAEDVRVGVELRTPTKPFPTAVEPFEPIGAVENARTAVCVRDITELEPELCADITTSTGRFYLPESDVIVHNCEDLACWLVAEKRVRFNLPARPVIIPQFQAPTPAQPNGSFLYHIVVACPDVPGGIDDPSRRLGMR